MPGSKADMPMESLFGQLNPVLEQPVSRQSHVPFISDPPVIQGADTGLAILSAWLCNWRTGTAVSVALTSLRAEFPAA